MHRQGRPVDPVFLPKELLFHRFEEKQYDGKNLWAPQIKFRNMSLNREKYGEPEDVLLPSWQACGIAEISFVEIPTDHTSDTGIPWQFRVEHDPCDFNYAHSELRTFKNGLLDESADLNVKSKKWIRQVLSDRLRIRKHPERPADKPR